MKEEYPEYSGIYSINKSTFCLFSINQQYIYVQSMNRSFDQSNKKIIDKQLLKESDQLDKDILVELREQNCKDFFLELC